MVRGSLLPILSLLLILAGCAATSTTGKPATYHYQMGISYLEERNYTAALVELTEAEKLDPSNAELQYHLGRTLIGKQQARPGGAAFPCVRLPCAPPIRKPAMIWESSISTWGAGTGHSSSSRRSRTISSTRSTIMQGHQPGVGLSGKGDYGRALEELEALRSASPRNPIVRVAVAVRCPGRLEQPRSTSTRGLWR